MFCRQCGSEVQQGMRFCTSCGAEQPPGGGGKGMSTAAKAVIISLVVVLVAAGAGIGIFFAVRGGSDGDNPPPPPGDNGETKASEKLAYLDSGDIYTIDLDGTGRRRITDRGDIVDFAVAPDASRMAFVVGSDDQSVIFKMGADGSDESQVTLPEKGWADNPVFDPDSKYIYFTRITPEGMADMEAGRPHAVEFERYVISANKVDDLASYEGLQEQSIVGLFVDPAGGDIYFNLFGSDYPSSVPHKLEVGPPVSETEYMPMETDAPGFDVLAYQLTGFSRDGADVSYYKHALYRDVNDNPQQSVYACFRPTGGGRETVIDSYTPSADEVGSVKGLEFSTASDARYYLAKVRSGGGASTSTTLEFYMGIGSTKPTSTGLDVTVSNNPERYTPLVWHLLHVK